MRKISRIAALRGNGILDVSYSGMPMENDDFGTNDAKVKMGFIGQTWEKPVKFRFAKHGTGASSAICESDGDVNAGDPNWYVYWLQVARKHGFGPKTRSIYVEDPATMDQTSNTLGLYCAHPEKISGVWRWADEIYIYGGNEIGAVRFVVTMNHENGHRESRQKPNSSGGWGMDFAYDGSDDQDGDCIFDEFEQASNGKYSVDDDTTDADNATWTNDDHLGICKRKEEAVEARDAEIAAKDYSWEESR